jgi:hypothetical protein
MTERYQTLYSLYSAQSGMDSILVHPTYGFPSPRGERAKQPRPISKQRDEKDEAETESWNTALLSISIHMMLHNTV